MEEGVIGRKLKPFYLIQWRFIRLYRVSISYIMNKYEYSWKNIWGFYFSVGHEKEAFINTPLYAYSYLNSPNASFILDSSSLRLPPDLFPLFPLLTPSWLSSAKASSRLVSNWENRFGERARLTCSGKKGNHEKVFRKIKFIFLAGSSVPSCRIK